MKIYLDVTPYFWHTEDKGGIYHYIARFLAHLPQDEDLVLFVRGRRVIVAEKVAAYARRFPLIWRRMPGQLHHLLPLLKGPGRFLSFWDDVPALWGLEAFSVVHDLRALFYEEELKPLEEGLPLYREFSRLKAYQERRRYFEERRRALLKTFKRARGFIAVSNFTAQNLVRAGIALERIKRIYHGPLPRVKTGKLPSFLEGRPFILYVGKIEPLKNIEGLLLAFEELRRKRPGIFLVLAGPLTWYGRFLKERWPRQKGVIFLDFVPEETLEVLYREAICLVFPSFYEGFGLPLLEAMSRGLPAVVSRAGSLPEIGGEACLYFDPLDPKDMGEKLLLLLEEPGLRQALARKGLKRAKSFSWSRCVRETLSFLKGPS